MQRKYQECITSFTLEAGRLMKAIRSTQALADNLPGNFPAPDRILVSRKPYDLKLEWEAEHTGHQKKLQNRVTAQLHLQVGYGSHLGGGPLLAPRAESNLFRLTPGSFSMKFMVATCKLCERNVFDSTNLRAFETTLAGVGVVDLQGKQPHAGMRCVCTFCISQLQGVLD
jgi:hypothetical protein